MPIPTQHDRALAEIDNLHGCVMASLRTQRYAAGNDQAVRERLRETLQSYVDRVMALAREQA